MGGGARRTSPGGACGVRGVPGRCPTAHACALHVCDMCACSWGKRMAIRYYQKLHKHYALADLTRYKEFKIGLRWRTEAEVAPAHAALVVCAHWDEGGGYDALFGGAHPPTPPHPTWAIPWTSFLRNSPTAHLLPRRVSFWLQVISGKGQFVCGSVHCEQDTGSSRSAGRAVSCASRRPPRAYRCVPVSQRMSARLVVCRLAQL